MTSIAIVGTEGSGKTVLLTALAKRYAKPRDGVSMVAGNKATAAYVQRCWAAMREGEWPPSTTPGEVVELAWKLQAGDEEHELRIVDSAGQDLRVLFSDGRIHDLAELPEEFHDLAAYVQNADVLVLLVNLKDFVGTVDDKQRLDNEWTIRGALDACFRRKPPPVCALVFTQIDNYPNLVEALGDWTKVAHEYLPNIDLEYRQGHQLPILAVQAVDHVEFATMGEESPRPVPVWDDGTSHQYLDQLMGWIVRACPVAAQQTAAAHRQQSIDRIKSSILGDPQENPAGFGRKRTYWLIAGAGLLFMFLVFACCGGISGISQDSAVSDVQTSYEGISGVLWDEAWLSVSFTNSAATDENFKITAEFYDGRKLLDRQVERRRVGAGQTEHVKFSITLPNADWENVKPHFAVELDN